MTHNYRKIGDYITVIDNRNTDGAITNLMGISIDKCYIPSVANVIGTDLNNYKVIQKGQFACSLMQVSRDQRIPVAMYEDDVPAIMSPAYVMFEVSRPEELLPEYMELWFKRAEFDREASFYAVGGVRGSLDWEDFLKMELPVPPFPEQQKIVRDYQVITDRIELLRKLNDNLEAQVMTLYHRTFDDACRDGVAAELGEIVGGATPSTENPEYFCDNGIVWLSPKDLTGTGLKFIFRGETDITEAGYNSCSTKMVPVGTVLLTSRAPVGTVAIAMKELCTNQGFKSIVPKAPCWTPYIYCLLKDNKQLLEANASGTTFLEISGDTLKKLVVPIPEDKLVQSFSEVSTPFFKQQMLYEQELTQLQRLVSIRVSSIAKGA